MTLFVRAAVVSLALGGLVLIAPQPAHADTCAKVSATTAGLHKATVAKRSKARLKRVINRWARQHGTKVVRVSPTRTDCQRHRAHWDCTSQARVCK